MAFLHQSCFCTCRPQPGNQPFNKYLVTVQNHCLNYVWKTVAASFYCIQTCSTYHHKQPNIKGQVHPELKIRPLSVHPHADGKSCKVSELTKHFWSYTTKLRCNIHLNSWGICGLVSVWKKTYSSSGPIQVFSSTFWMSGLLETWFTSDKVFVAIIVFF